MYSSVVNARWQSSTTVSAGKLSSLVIAEATTVAEIRSATHFLYPSPGTTQSVATNLIRAMCYTKNFLATAVEETTIIGACLGFCYLDGGTLVLLSHYLLVNPNRRRSGVGYRLKRFQANWAQRNGIKDVRWTFDPLLITNGQFNLNKLGAIGVEYFNDFYGSSSSEADSDRILVSWQPSSEPKDRLDHIDAKDSEVIVSVDERVVPRSKRSTSFAAENLLVELPTADLRSLDLGTVRRWQEELRWSIGGAMSCGYRLVAFSQGRYVLRRASPANKA